MKNPSGPDIVTAADQQLVRNAMTWLAFVSIFWGVFAFVAGLSSISTDLRNGLLLIIGSYLIVVGCWVSIAPRPIGFIFEGVGLLAIGAWSITLKLMEPPRLASDWAAPILTWRNLFAVLGILQVVWGFKSFVLFFRHWNAPSNQPLDPAAVAELQRLRDEMRSVRPDSDQAVIEFETKTFNGPTTKWRAKLVDSEILFVAYEGDEVLRVSHEDVYIKVKSRSPGEAKHFAEFSLGPRTFSGFISPASAAKYKNWKDHQAEGDEFPKKCPWCGQKYARDVSNCRSDGHALVS